MSRGSNLPTVWTNCLAAWVLGSGEITWLFIPLLLGASFIYSAGMILNDAADFEWDRHHRPERPIPEGIVSVKLAYVTGAGCLLVGLLLFLLSGVSILWAVLLIAAIVVYNVTHKKWEGSIYVMGACRFILYLCVASAPEAGSWWPQKLVWIWGLALGIYTVGITLAARGETQDAPLKNLAIGFLSAPAVAMLLTYLLRDPGDGKVWVLCLAVWIGWTAWSVKKMRGEGEGRIGQGVGNLLAGIILIDAMAVAPVLGGISLVIVIMLPIVLLLQRKVAAT